MTSLVLHRVEVHGRHCDVLVRDGRVADVGGPFRGTGPSAIDGAGGALVPGLHDHHLHLLALAVDLTSVRCGPSDVRGADDLAGALRAAAATTPPGAWLRGTGYHERVAGDLDARALDRLLPDRPVRVQHRSGALWMLNSLALQAVAAVLDDSPDVERDEHGRPTGRLWRYDARLRPALPPSPPDLIAVGRLLARHGITGVSDATPDLDEGALDLLRSARGAGLHQDLCLLGAPLDQVPRPGLPPWKILLRDHDLPGLEALTAEIARARAAGRAVAVHCVTRVALLLTLTALQEVGPLAGDRIEHGAVVPPEVRDWMRRLGVTVVTQPGFVATRGDDYLRDTEPDDRDCLYPYHSLLEAAVPTVASSDAPYGPVDPWAIMRAARDRRTPSGTVLLPGERVTVATALNGYLAPLLDPAAPPREIRPGAPADLVLLSGSLQECLADPDAERVRLVLKDGMVVHSAS